MADANDAALKKKFELLQQQQHQKLENRKKKKQQEEKQKIEQNSNIQLNMEKSSSSAFGIDDELDLKVNFLSINIFFF